MDRYFELRLPSVSTAIMRNAKLDWGLRVIGTTKAKEMIVVDGRRRFGHASNALFPGWLVPSQAETEPIENAMLRRVIIKLSGDECLDDGLKNEQMMLEFLAEEEGVPEVLAAGEALVHYKSINWAEVKRSVPFIVLSYLPGADLFTYQLSGWGQNNPSREAVSLVATKILPALAERLARLHARQVVHRDAKPNNALFDEKTEQLSLVDFGISNWLFADSKTETGLVGYYPPERCLELQSSEDVRMDTYAFGISAFVLLTGRVGLLYANMRNIWDLDMGVLMQHGWKAIIDNYYQGINVLAGKTPEQLVCLSNCPPELKETPLGRYLPRLFHPDIEQRPTDLRVVADDLRRLGGELLSHNLNTPVQ